MIKQDHMPRYIIAIGGLVCSLITYAFVMAYSTAQFRTQMQADLKALNLKIDQAHSNDSVLSKHWKLHQWAKTRINEERQARDAALVEWPALD